MATTAREIVEDFFERMEDEDRRATIGELFAEDAVITVPGARFSGPDAPSEMLEYFGPPRYEWVAKEFDRWVPTERGLVSIGRLYGVDADGNDFSDVRYVDVYEIEDGRITHLDIWNDLADEGII